MEKVKERNYVKKLTKLEGGGKIVRKITERD